MNKKAAALLAGAALVLFSAILLFGSCLSRDSDDETIYTALAAKIGSRGLTAYNLRDTSIEPAGHFWKIESVEGGNLLGLMAGDGVSYYDVPFYFNPPLFPAALFLSHEILNRSTHFLLLKRDAPAVFHGEQVYAAFPNALFAVLFLAGVYMLGKRRFDVRTGLLAALLCLVSPVFLVTSFKTWSDLMAASLLVWSYLFWGEGESSTAELVFSGALFGLAVLTRISSLFVLPLFFCRRWKSLLIWSVPALLLALPWFFQVARVYGTPFYFPEAASAKDSLDWLKSISRPWYFYILDLAYLSPFFAAALFAFSRKTARLFGWFFLLLAPLSALIYTSKPLGVEDRYLLPCYPALAVLSAHALLSFKKPFFKTLAAAGLSAACFWSLRLGMMLVISRESLHLVAW